MLAALPHSMPHIMTESNTTFWVQILYSHYLGNFLIFIFSLIISSFKIKYIQIYFWPSTYRSSLSNLSFNASLICLSLPTLIITLDYPKYSVNDQQTSFRMVFFSFNKSIPANCFSLYGLRIQTAMKYMK